VGFCLRGGLLKLTSGHGVRMKAQAVYDHLRSLDRGWVDWATTTDRFVVGSPDTEIIGIAVGWMSFTWALQRALELSCNLFITHEPTYFSGHDDEEGIFRFAGVRAKRTWIEQSGLTILRCHDVWDQLPGIGIPDAWAQCLGFDEPIAGDGYYRVYREGGRTARSIALQVAERTKSLGQHAVELIGPADAPVFRVAIGTGAITPFPHFLDAYGADLAICTDDGFTYWHAGALAIDVGIPVIVVNHAVSELPGVRLLADHLAKTFPEVPVCHISQACMFELVPSPRLQCSTS
jgi:putative NIF3 family GTP cyclohydrolase 1 type 2